jgi:hypothetical protein
MVTVCALHYAHNDIVAVGGSAASRDVPRKVGVHIGIGSAPSLPIVYPLPLGTEVWVIGSSFPEGQEVVELGILDAWKASGFLQNGSFIDGCWVKMQQPNVHRGR